MMFSSMMHAYPEIIGYMGLLCAKGMLDTF